MNNYWVNFAEENGYVETIPDKLIDPDRGYPIQCATTEDGGILGTNPLSFHVQGTAMQCTNVAMVLCADQIKDWNKKTGNNDIKMIVQQHDELIFEFPKRADPIKNKKASNFYAVQELKKLMESTGDRIDIPLSCNVDYHPDNWGKAITIM